MTLTRRQQEILDRLHRRDDAGEPPPTLDELCRVVQAEAGQKDCLSKGGGRTECDGKTCGESNLK